MKDCRNCKHLKKTSAFGITDYYCKKKRIDVFNCRITAWICSLFEGSRCNMIIRSQDKLRIEKFNNAEVGHSCNTVHVNGLTFGVYSTEEKAIKVLDMICDACRNIAFVDEKSVVFDMPQDSEV